MTKVPLLNIQSESVGFVFLGRTPMSIEETGEGYIKYYFEFWLEEPGRSIMKRIKYRYNSPEEVNQRLFYKQKNDFKYLKDFKTVRLEKIGREIEKVEISRNFGWDKYKISVDNGDVICFGMGRE